MIGEMSRASGGVARGETKTPAGLMSIWSVSRPRVELERSGGVGDKCQNWCIKDDARPGAV